ncbi:MAG: hypothetical protein IPH64_14590 [Comamonadaceae bacterium]|nr:hypothetical protein [Comamonadaceae bacterium]
MISIPATTVRKSAWEKLALASIHEAHQQVGYLSAGRHADDVQKRHACNIDVIGGAGDLPDQTNVDRKLTHITRNSNLIEEVQTAPTIAGLLIAAGATTPRNSNA